MNSDNIILQWQHKFWTKQISICTSILTRSPAVAEGPREQGLFITCMLSLAPRPSAASVSRSRPMRSRHQIQIQIQIYLHWFTDSTHAWPATANFDLPHLHLVPPWGWLRSNFEKIFGIRILDPSAIMWHCLRYLTFSYFSTTPTCDRHRHGYTQTQGHGIYHAEHSSHGKNDMAHS